MGKYRIPLALFGYFIMIGNITLSFTYGFSAWLERLSIPSAGLVMLSFCMVWGTALAGVAVPFYGEENEKDDSNEALFRLSWAFALGWFFAWICTLPLERDLSFRGSSMTLMLFMAWSFAAAICMAQEMPRFKMRFSLG